MTIPAQLLYAIRRLHRAGATAIVGLQGGQGTGKTTLARQLVSTLAGEGYRVVSLSIDDYYTSSDERERLAARHGGNPWYGLARGMPGTHRTQALHDALIRLTRGDDVDLAVFDKSAHGGRGDIADHVVSVRGRQDFVIFEGWFLGMPVATAAEVIASAARCDAYDSADPPDPAHLEAVLGHVAPYQRLWTSIHFLVMLRPDSLHSHRAWRRQQERELIERTGAGMSEAQVDELVCRFLPFTCLCYERIVPDMRIAVADDHALRVIEEERE